MNVPSNEWLGHVASLLVLVSLTMTSLERLRWLNLAGAVAFAVYGARIGATPVATVNSAIVLINIFYLVRMYSRRDYFKLMIMDPDNDYLKSFFEFYEDDIRKWYPMFSVRDSENQFAILTLRNMAVAGILVACEEGNQELRIELDFAVPQYADRKVGRHLYHDKKGWFLEHGYRRLVVTESNVRNGRYFRSMGFRNCNHQGPDLLMLDVGRPTTIDLGAAEFPRR